MRRGSARTPCLDALTPRYLASALARTILVNARGRGPRRRQSPLHDYSSSPCNVKSHWLLDAVNPGTKRVDAAGRRGVKSTLSGVRRTSVAAHTTSAINHPTNG